jgi:hypothetical protein
VNTWTIQSRFVRAQVQSLGAMLGPAWFSVGGRDVQPFAIGPWAEDSGAEYDRLPPLLKRLRGEWACIPFGIEGGGRRLPPEWLPLQGAPDPESLPHGHSSNADWQLAGIRGDRVDLILAYPEPHPVSLLRRSIWASDTRPELHISLAVEVRESCELPIGVHPTFNLPAEPRTAVLMLGGSPRAWTPPVPLESVIGRFRSDVRGVPLDRIPLLNGGSEDITRLPLPYQEEEIVLVPGESGEAILQNLAEKYTVTVSWDAKVFPACQLWLSNCGRSAYPWNSRFRALAIEPVCAAFDFGTWVSRHRGNPLWQAGVPCTVSLSPDEPFETSYCIAVS